MTDQFRADTSGDEAIKKLADALRSPYFFEPVVYQAGLMVQAFMKPYPVPPPNSSYRRTQTLGRRWTVEKRRDLFGVRALVGNNTPYAPYVQQAARQAWIHDGRWQTDEDAVKKMTPQIEVAVVIFIEGQMKRVLVG